MNFRETEDYLFSLGNEVETMKLGLENISTLLDALDRPQDEYLKVQVAGTNGKGSVCAFLDSICLQAGIKTGLYTSPHLISITERIKIGNADAGEEEFAALATRVRTVSEDLVGRGRLERVPTFFEQVTAIALLGFAEAGVELAILETGLGGRFDAVTAAGAEIAVITRIDLDHQEYLGDTIEKIAAEKAAIIHPGSKAILFHQDKNVERVLTARCREVGVDPVWASDEIEINNEPLLGPVLTGSITTEKAYYPSLEFRSMLGRHQFENAAIAVCAAEMLVECGFSIEQDEVIAGLAAAVHPGRLERISNFLLDGAHNPGGARALSAYLDEFVNPPITMIFGAMHDKDVSSIAEILWPKAESLILTRPSNSRAMGTHELLRFLPASIDRGRVVLADSVEESLDLAQTRSHGSTVVVTGSLYLVGEARKLLKMERAV